MGITVEGNLELLRILSALPDLVDDAIPEIAVESSSLVEDSAKQTVPVITGQLRDSIITEVSRAADGSLVVEIGPTKDYADDVEFGGLRRLAKPYLRPAIDENEDAVVQAIAAKLQSLLSEV